ncbi:hypothetical protein B0J12DRAFT_418148 [Macrophomina phaseolina]|uniref:Secreted protein n=1 Tax=Macrophomina phaseolina TaxID=35725 RepID=A0ABQ8FU41_9PEZI|nr:hypothetical protein B0J12DRAFT_418148 [Macrophomina phaseolina]
MCWLAGGTWLPIFSRFLGHTFNFAAGQPGPCFPAACAFPDPVAFRRVRLWRYRLKQYRAATFTAILLFSRSSPALAT